MDSRFLCSEEQVVHFPLTTSPCHQLARNLLHSAALYFAPIFTPMGLLGTCLWALVCREAGSGTHKDFTAQSNIFGLLYAAHGTQKLGMRSKCLRWIWRCIAPLGQQKAFWVHQQIYLHFCSLALARMQKEESPALLQGKGECYWGMGALGAAPACTGNVVALIYLPWMLPAGKFQ